MANRRSMRLTASAAIGAWASRARSKNLRLACAQQAASVIGPPLQRPKLSKNNDTTKAINYILTHWDAFTRFLDDGRICLSNNAAERELRTVAMTDSFYTPSSSICKH